MKISDSIGVWSIVFMTAFVPALTSVGLPVASSAVDLVPVGDMGTLTTGVSKDMVCFLHYIDDNETSKTFFENSTWYYFDTTRDWSASPAFFRVSAAQQAMNWFLYPPLAGNFSIKSFELVVWVQRIGGAGNPNNKVSIYEVNETGNTLLHTKTSGGPGIIATPTEQHYPSDASWTGHTFPAGSTILVSLEVNPGAGNTFDYLFDTATYDSRIIFNSSDSMDVSSGYLLDGNGDMRSDLDPRPANKDVRLRVNVTDQFGGYDVEWVNLTLRDPASTVILDNVTMAKVVGNPKTFLNVYEYQWNYSGQPAGKYNITIWALDKNGDRYKNYDSNPDYWEYDVVFNWNFSIGEVKFLNIRVRDSLGVALQGAVVTAFLNDSKTMEGVNVTNSSGMVNMTLITARYELVVSWSNTPVADVVYDLVSNVPAQTPLEVAASVYYPSLRFKDGHGLALENASINIVCPNETLMGPFRTNATGEVYLPQSPGGPYRVIARWRDVQVNDTPLAVSANTNYTISTAVHYMTVMARDDIGGLLPGAQIVMANSTTAMVFDSKVTNLSGAIICRLPAGLYDVSIFWQNSRVYDRTNVSFFGDLLIDAWTGIYVLNITALDGHLAPVAKARVLVMTVASQSVVESNFTDMDGKVRSRLPAGAHMIRAYWREVLVNETIIDLSGNHDVTVAMAVHYPTIKVVDDGGSPLSDARVSLFYASSPLIFGTGLTDQDGRVVFRTPATDYDLMVTWRDRTVNLSAGVALVSDDTVTVVASVYHTGIRVVDPHGMPLEEARVDVAFTDGTRLGSYVTDINGTIAVQLPLGDFDIRTVWNGVLVNETLGFHLDTKLMLTLVGSVYYVNITAQDSRAVPLDGAFVSIKMGASGDILGAISTDVTASALFRVPSGAYDIDVVWSDHPVLSLTNRTIEKDEDLVLDCAVHYLDISVADSREIGLTGASVTVQEGDTATGPGNGTVATEGDTGVGGVLGLRLPAEIYSLRVSWLGVVVNTTEGLVVDMDIALNITAWVYYFTPVIVDSRNVPLAGASVTVAMTATGGTVGPVVTDTMGRTTLRSPGRTGLNVTAIWSGLEVLTVEGHVLESDSEVVFHASVFYANLTFVDTGGNPAEEAWVVLKVSDGGVVMASGRTASDGSVVFRVPGTLFDVEVTWSGVTVLKDILSVVRDTDLMLTVKVSVLTVVLMDSRDVPVSGANVALGLLSTGAVFGTGRTDVDGKATARLPHGQYDLSVYWWGVPVAEPLPFTLDKDTTMDLDASVYYLELMVQDDRGLPLEDAVASVVMMGRPDVSSVNITAADGSTTARLPAAGYSVDVDWKGERVAMAVAVDLSNDTTVIVDARVFFLTVKAMDGSGKGLRGVSVMVSGSEGAVVGWASTGGDGKAEFRLPAGEYDVRSRFVTTYMMSNVDKERNSKVSLTSSMELNERFSDYPPAVYLTNAFVAGTLWGLLIALLVALIVVRHIKRGREKRAEEGYIPVEGADADPEISDVEEGDQENGLVDEKGGDDGGDDDEGGKKEEGHGEGEDGKHVQESGGGGKGEEIDLDGERTSRISNLSTISGEAEVMVGETGPRYGPRPRSKEGSQ